MNPIHKEISAIWLIFTIWLPLLDKVVSKMRIGYVVIGAQISWVIFSITYSLWVFQYKFHIVSAILMLLSCGLWLKCKENRVKFRNAMSSSMGREEQSLLDHLSNSIRIGMISIFALFVVLSEVSKLIISESDGYKFIKTEIVNNPAVKEHVGTIQYVALGNDMSFHHSFTTPEQSLKTSLLVFGDKGHVKLDAAAFKTYDSWEIENLTIGD